MTGFLLNHLANEFRLWKHEPFQNVKLKGGNAFSNWIHKKKQKPEQKQQQKQTTVEGGDKKDIFSLSADDHITQDSSAFTSWYCEHVLYGRAI